MILERISKKVTDCHVHIGFCEKNLLKSEENIFISKEDIRDYLDKYQINKALIFPFPNKKASAYESNKYIVEILKEENRFRGLLYFSFDEGIESLSGFSHSNIVGVKVHPAFSGVEASRLPLSLLKMIRDNGWFLLIDSSISKIGHPRNIIELAKENSDIQIIVAHMARIFHKEILEIACLENLYLDISGICLLADNDYRLSPVKLRHSSLKKEISSRKILEYLIEFVGYEKIIWGSDFPFPDFLGGSIKKEVDFILQDSLSFVDRKSLKGIINDNLELLIKGNKV